MVLTNTQLIFLKDSIWALALREQIERLGHDLRLSPGTLLLPTFTDFRPDEVIGLAGSAAVFDRSYAKVSYCAHKITQNVSHVRFLVPPVE